MNPHLKVIITSGALLLGATCILSPSAPAQETKEVTTTTTTTVTTNGTVTQFVPADSVFVRTDSSTVPLRYNVTRETVFVDETGAPVVVDRITPGLPVVVHYTRAGDRLVAARIVVRKAPSVVEERTTTTSVTTTPGTISQFIPGSRIVLKSAASLDPVPYVITKQTTFVDETGAPVVVDRFVPGQLVTVYYTREGDQTLATKVVMSGAPPPPRKLTHDEKERLEDQIEKQTEAEKRRLEEQEKRLKKQLKDRD